jgi:hypothetical protein
VSLNFKLVLLAAGAGGLGYDPQNIRDMGLVNSMITGMGLNPDVGPGQLIIEFKREKPDFPG